MGLSKNSNKTFLNIQGGKIIAPCQAGTPDSFEKNGKHYVAYDRLEGTIIGVGTRDREYEGKPYIEQWVDVQDKDGTIYQLQFRTSGGYFRSFVSQLPNVDVTKPVSFSPAEKEEIKEGAKKKTYTLFLNQNGKGVGWFFTKDKPNGMPELEPIVHKGKTTGYDSEARDKFCLDYVNTTFAATLMGKGEAAIIHGDSGFPEDDTDTEFQTTDDLPF